MTTHVCGGFSEERPVDEEAAGVLESCRAEVEEKVGAGYVADIVKTQVVAGMNFSYRGKLANGKHTSVKIYRPLPHTNQPPRVTNVLVASVEGDTMTVEKMWDEAVQGVQQGVPLRRPSVPGGRAGGRAPLGLRRLADDG